MPYGAGVAASGPEEDEPRGDTDDARRLEGDLRVALLSGTVGWRDRNSYYSPAELTVACVLATNVAAVVTMLMVSAGLPAREAAIAGNARWIAAVAASLTLVAGVAPTIAWPFGWRPRHAGPTWRLVAVRVGAAMVAVGCWTALMGPISPIPAWPLGGVVGCECVLTAWALGMEPRGIGWWWWRFQKSSVNAGVVLFCLLVVAIGPERFTEVLAVLLTVQVITLSAALTAAGLTRLNRVFEKRAGSVHRTALAEGHGRMAYWLHNAVTTPLRDMRLKVQRGDMTVPEIAAALEETEHQLRRRQLGEVLETGTAQLAELLQAHVRRAQELGVEVVEVPRFADPGITVEGDVGRLVQRALDVLVPNAIAAGAQRLAFRVATASDSVTVEVEDDAGGFDLASVPAGRALHGLQQDLGDGRVTCVATGAGSRVRVVVPSDGAR